jgi:hypothetical protein
MKFRNYNPEKDRDAVQRMWREIGWLREGQEQAMDLSVEGGRALVADVNGEAECVVTAMPGTVRYLDKDLPLSCVTAVTTSRIARRQGLAKRLTAQIVASDAADGALASALGMFEQGFYNQLGFGTGGYEHRVSFDPARLNVGVRARVPRRLTKDDWAMVHASRLARSRGHGACNLLPPEFTRSQMLQIKNGFGLGYCDGPKGELTHHFWYSAKQAEFGPYDVIWMTYQTAAQFLELMALLKSLGDQVRLVTMREPGGIQFQDLIEQPLKQRQVSEKSEFQSIIRAIAYWQMRICDLQGCLAHTHLQGNEVRFNLALTDPIARFLDKGGPWRGSTGDYVVTLGPSSGAESGTDAALPTLTASVGAFTRMWLGVRPATGLAVTDELSGPQALLEELDLALRLPDPKPDWDF